MAQTKRKPRAQQTAVRLVEAPPAAAPGGIELEPGEIPFDDVLARLRAELGDDQELKVQVYRIEGKGKAGRVFCDSYTFEQIGSEDSFQERIRDDWGGGTYRLICHDTRGFRLNREVTIAERRGAPASDDLAALRAEVARLTSRPPDSEEQILARLKMYRDLFAPAGGGGQRDDMQAFMRGVEFARGAGRSTSPAEQLKDMLDMIEGARTLREKIDAPNPEPSLAMLGVEALKTISGLVKGAPAPADGALPMIAIPQQLADGAGATQPTQGQPVSMNQPVLEAVSYLNGFARMNASPAPVAELVYEQSPDELLAFLARPDWFGQLALIAPEVRPFEQWYRATHAELVKITAENAAPAAPAKSAMR